MAEFHLKGFGDPYTDVPGLNLNNLGDGDGDDSQVIDLGSSEQPYLVAVMARLNGTGGGQFGTVDFFAKWSDNFDPTFNNANLTPIGAVLMDATGSVERGFVFPIEGRYFIMRAVNNSGASTGGSDNIASYVAITQVSTG